MGRVGSAFRGKSVVIVGASTGIGADLAMVLARSGARLVLVARRRELLEEVAARCAGEGGERPLVIPADVASQESMEKVRDLVLETVGVPDVVIANAAIGISQPSKRITLEAFRQIMEINVLGVGYSLIPFIAPMVERGHGHLAAVSSMAGYRGMPSAAAYSASKSAVTTFMEGLRLDLRRSGIDVTTIQPGFVATPMTAKNRFKMPFLLTSFVAAERIACALAGKKRVYAFPWQAWLMMKLVAVLPVRLYDWIFGRFKI